MGADGLDMNEAELPLSTPIRFTKGEGNERKQVLLKIFKDKSAYVSGDEEIIFEGVGPKAPWKDALEYLERHGYIKEDDGIA